jgi:hypothetical protein
MEKTAKYLILSIGMGLGAYFPTLFGASSFGGWSILGTLVGGIAGVAFIARIDE